MKKRILSILLALSMVLTIAPAAFAAETPDENAITDADTLIAAIQAADDGATVEIPAGNFSIGNLTIAKAVSLSGEGADETTLTGSIMYEANSSAAEDGAAITVSGITLEPSGNQNHQGLCWNNHGTLSGYNLNVEGCIFDGWEYAIGVNSGAAGNTLNVSDTVFTNTFCAMAVKIGNTVFTEDVDTAGSDYAIQVFGKSSDNADYFNGYYESVGDYTDDLKDETLDNPTVGGYTSGEGKVIVATPADFERNLASANDGDTIQLTTGAYKLSNELLTIERRVNLKGAGEDKTTMIGTVKYKLAAVDETADAALSVSGINFAAGDNALQGLVFTGTAANTEQHVDITVSDCSFDGWTYGLAMHSHANCCILNVENSTFDTWCGINFNNDASNEAHPANNTLNIGEGNDFNCSYAVEQYDNGNTATGSADVDYYETAEDYEAGTPVEVTRVLNATQLQDAVNSATDATTIELAGNITLASSITVPTGADITIKGNGYTISYDGSAPVSKTAFTGSGEGVEQEGIPEDVSLTVSDTTFQNTSQTPAGYAVLLDFNADGTKIAMNGCTFENLYCGVYVNPVMDGTITPPVISITNSTYNNTTYGYSVDEVTNGAVVGGVKTTFDGNKGIMTEAEAWEDAVAATVISNGVEKAYQSWAAAYAAAGEDDTIKLQQNITGPITIGKAVTIDGNGKTITAESGDAITVTAAGVVLNNVNAETTAENNLGHALVVGSDQTKVDGAITVSGGSYAAGNGDMQGQGAIRIFAAGEVKVENTATTGGIHVFDAGSYTITGNTVGFTYEGDTPYVGILVFYTEEQTGLDGEAVASGLLDGNTVAVPNTSSIYAQVVNGGWEDGSTDGVAADDSVAMNQPSSLFLIIRILCQIRVRGKLILRNGIQFVLIVHIFTHIRML